MEVKDLKKDLKYLLLTGLSVDLNYESDYGGKYLTVSISFDGDEICEDRIRIEEY